MDVNLIIKVAGVGILVAATHQILSKSGRDEQAMLVTVTGIVVVLLMLIQQLSSLFSSIKSIFGL
ncbi:MAG: stage III sporulation protein AC [Clostridia bacterium]|jgi:stage III sporulation protein AC|nr:stage III sporulation protein AC [Clostridia bacterium]